MNFFSKTMTLNNPGGTPYLTHNSLSEISCINHAISTRLGGVSSGDCATMNTDFNRDDREKVTENFHRICDSAGFEFDSLTASRQDHHTFVRAVTRENRGTGIYKPHDMDSVDALITNESGVTLVINVADCTPVFLVDPVKRAVGLAHAGYKGTLGCIAVKMLKKMTSLYGTNPSDVFAAIGPAIGGCCYEVDPPHAWELEAMAREMKLRSSAFIRECPNDKFMLDLPECNRLELIAAGVEGEKISMSDLCTKCNSDLLWSHRATKGRRGAMSGFICLR